MWPQRVLNSLLVSSYPCLPHLILACSFCTEEAKATYTSSEDSQSEKGIFRLSCVWDGPVSGVQSRWDSTLPAAGVTQQPPVMSGHPHPWG